jgi:gas vesicle protein GvpN
MKYIETHQRKVRGESVHKTKEDKNEEMSFKETHVQVTMSMKEMEPDNCERSGMPGLTAGEYETVDAQYLVPEVENFVDAPDVRTLDERIKLWLTAGYPVHLIGPTGCGKTSLAMHIAEELDRPVVWINGDESVTTSDLVGGYSQIQQESMRDKYIHNVFKTTDVMKADWIDNPLAIACKYGYTLVYNEFSRTKPSANNALLSVFEEGILELPTKFGEERYIKVHPNFNAILTSNSIEYAGVHRPQDALLDRMVCIYMDYYTAETEVKIVQSHTGLSEEEAAKIVNVVRVIRDKLPDAQKPGTRACIMIGKAIAALNESNTINIEQLYFDVMSAKTSSTLDMLEKQNLVRETIMVVA